MKYRLVYFTRVFIIFRLVFKCEMFHNVNFYSCFKVVKGFACPILEVGNGSTAVGEVR